MGTRVSTSPSSRPLAEVSVVDGMLSSRQRVCLPIPAYCAALGTAGIGRTPLGESGGCCGAWDVEQVLALAPDPASAKAGQGQARAAKWSGLGSSERALWGLCQGSGKKPYQTVVDLSGPAFKCTLPEPEVPLQARARADAALGGRWAAGRAEEPEWVDEWLEERALALRRRRAGRAEAG